MKNLCIITLLCIITGIGQAQTYNLGNSIAPYDTATFTISGTLKESVKSCYDTIPVLLLITDTSQFEQDRLNKKHQEAELRMLQDTISINRMMVVYMPKFTTPISYHIKGFDVIEHYWAYHPDYTVINESMSQRHIAWLDENKKPLSKTIVVWQSLNLK